MHYQVPIEISRQEDGLWRVSAPHLQACWVDAPTLEEAISQIQEAIAMAIDIDTKHGKSLPPEITQSDSLPIKTHLPIKPSEFTFKRFYKKPKVKAFQE